ncbi:SGNH/GDSL hydrolase family protein [Allorhodopirellula solitaria]|uniref:GDSL-like Lipase/Acylhydrolase n=1 Tax=Allorhodopirellula solitaria TaxID=2527987 RepID=A0A5C5YJP9_9BACT|nr:SGNH/GDSL hydrolase family protein [Allorhodopirellula solitaria]TWT75062.1 GDSL-like Lipase/Acylhydrolase [Allorhodopirellula solitaria]
MTHSIDRRVLFQATAASIVAGVAASPYAAAAPLADTDSSESVLPQGATILFQGDSITDAGRARPRDVANDARALGNGYPMLLATELLRDHADEQLKVYNRGISGNKVPDLAARWQADCLDLKPAVLSILIGVNDIWHKLSGKYDGTVADYESGFKALLEETQSKLPDTRIVICEPFVLRCGAVNDEWFPEFTQRREAARRVASERSLEWVPFQEMFDEASKVTAPEYWAADGVHPTLAGHSLMAQTWRQTTGI